MTSTRPPGPFLEPGAAVPVDRPFTWSEAAASGVPARQLRAWCEAGLLLRPVKGVYHSAELPDGIELRLACLRLVVPDDAVVTDRTAGWLHGAPMILAPGDHLVVPDLSMYRPPGLRLRGKLVDSGERTFRDDDVVTVAGILVTTPLRTACDLGRLLHRDQGIAALDALHRTGAFTVSELVAAVERFRGQRGVRQLRGLAPLTDGRSESPGESVLRLRWRDCPELPAPRPQVPVLGPDGPCFLDLGVEALRYAAEYDGAAWHTEETRGHDARRRDWLRRHDGWIIDVLRSPNVYGRGQDADVIVRRGIAAARRRFGSRAWSGVTTRQVGAPAREYGAGR